MSQFEEFEDLVNDVSFREWVLSENSQHHEFWENWIKDHPDKATEVKQAKKFILLSAQQVDELTTDEVNAEVEKFYQRIENPPAKSFRITPALRWIAAAVLILGVASTLFFLLPNQKASNWLTDSTQNGEQKVILLEDGTKVTLNVSTQLTYPEKFAKDKREVSIDGEAFFEVVRDESRPFIVKGGVLDVQVLGTTFNVSNYKEDDQVDVELISGAVMVKLSDSDSNGIVPLRVQEKFSFQKTPGNWSVDKITSEKQVDWKNGTLYFNNTPLDRIFREMERWFDTKIEIRNKTLLPMRFTGTFEGPTMESVLEGIGFILDFNYTIKEDKVVIEFTE